MVECPKCGKEFEREQNLRVHIGYNHPSLIKVGEEENEESKKDKGLPTRSEIEELSTFKREQVARENETVYPKNAIIEVTQRCPLQCKHCFLGDKDTEELPADKWFEIMDKLYYSGVESLVIEGGEPTVHQDFYRILEYATQKFDSVSVQTSGVTDTRLNQYDCNVTISFEYFNPIRNNKIRRRTDPDKYKYDTNYGLVYKKDKEKDIKKTLKAINQAESKKEERKYIKKLKDTAKGNAEEVENTHTLAGRKLNSLDGSKTLRATIYNDNEIIALANLAESLNANSVFVPLKPVGLGKELKHKAPSMKRLRDVIRKVRIYNSRTEMKHRVEETYWYIDSDKIWNNYKDVFAGRGRVCESGINRVFVDYMGNVKPCFMLPEEDMGNILENDLNEIRHNLYKWDRRAAEIAEESMCSECLGGCIAVAKNNNMPENPCVFKKGD